MDVSKSRNLNNRINRINERALRLVYQNNLGFSELLDLDNSVTVHQKNLQVFVTEMYKGKNGIPPGKIFFNYNLGEKTKTVHYGLQSVKYLGPKLWEPVLKSTKVSNS